MSFLLVEGVVYCPDGTATLVQFNSYKTLVQREVVANGILWGGADMDREKGYHHQATLWQW